MGNDIRDTIVNFNTNRKLIPEEIEEVIFYCNHDVDQTMHAFMNRKEEYDSHMSLIKTFNLSLSYINKTKAKLLAIILEADRVHDRNDEFDITIVDTLRLNKYIHIMEWYKNHINRDYKKSLDIDIAGVPHTFGWGGLHGARTQYQGEGIFINSDAGSFHPALMIEYNFLSRNVRHPEKYKEIRDKRLEFKKVEDLIRSFLIQLVELVKTNIIISMTLYKLIMYVSMDTITPIGFNRVYRVADKL